VLLVGLVKENNMPSPLSGATEGGFVYSKKQKKKALE
jgi:hypothetical protein